jgi:hypothetical protein
VAQVAIDPDADPLKDRVFARRQRPAVEQQDGVDEGELGRGEMPDPSGLGKELGPGGAAGLQSASARRAAFSTTLLSGLPSIDSSTASAWRSIAAPATALIAPLRLSALAGFCIWKMLGACHRSSLR